MEGGRKGIESFRRPSILLPVSLEKLQKFSAPLEQLLFRRLFKSTVTIEGSGSVFGGN